MRRAAMVHVGRNASASHQRRRAPRPPGLCQMQSDGQSASLRLRCPHDGKRARAAPTRSAVGPRADQNATVGRYAEGHYPYNATFFTPLFLGAYDGQDTPGDCAVGPRPQRRGSPQSYTPGGATQLGITGGAATPSALVLFSPKRPFKCQRKKWASIVSNMW